MSWFRSRVLALLLGAAAPAFANDKSAPQRDGPDNPDEGEPTAAPASPRSFDLPHIDYPPLQSLGPGSSLYVDHTYETTTDLSTFWWVKGSGTNYRLALGGLYQIGDLRLHVQVPLQFTRLFIDSLMGLPPTDADRNKSSLSLGDIITAGSYFWDLSTESARTFLGLGLRVRWPTHTTKYRFGLIDGSILEFGFPYYLHLAPGVLLSTNLGPLRLTLNEGVLAMLARDVWIGDVLQPIPNVYFWESHAAVDVAAADWLDFSLEFMSFIQLNQVGVSNMNNLNGTKALFINPGVTIDFGGYRLSLAARLGLPGRSTRDFGVITFSGSNAYLARLSYMF